MTQQDLILAHLKAGNSITQQQANDERFKYCTRLASVVMRLRRKGHQITSEKVVRKDGKWHSRYWLKND